MCHYRVVRVGGGVVAAAQVTPGPVRILVTGSREWTDWRPIYRALNHLYSLVQGATDQPMLVVHGDARGADRHARNWVEQARGLHYLVDQEPHAVTPRQWTLQGKAAGNIRNQLMVNLGARLCVAFSRNNSRGTANCADLARQAGIPVWWHVHGYPAPDAPTRFILGL